MKDNKDGPNKHDPQAELTARRARDNRRLNARVQKNAGRQRAASVGSDEASSLLGTTGKRKKVQMSNAQALKILGLTVGEHGYPLPITINQARDKLLSKNSPETGGNPRKYEEISLAANHLTKYQERLLKQYKEDLKETYKDYQNAVGPTANELKARDREKRKHDVVRGETMDAIGKELYELGDTYLTNLMQSSYGDPRHSLKRTHTRIYTECLNAIPESEPNKQLLALQNTYYKVRQDIMKKCNDMPLNEQDLVRAAAKPIDVDPNSVFKHLPLDLKNQEKEEVTVTAEDPLEAFQDQYHDYLNDILAMQAEYTHHKGDFQELHDTLQDLGRHYIADMKKPDANLEALSKQYAEDFQAATTKAKADFAQEPGIWANLSGCLKSLFTALFFIKYIISLSETEVDRNRMYQPEKFSIQDRWETWKMDCMPTIDQTLIQRKQNN